MIVKLLFAASSLVQDPGLPKVGEGGGAEPFKIVLQVIFAIMGAVAVLIIVLSGFKFVTSGGNPEEVKKAKGTIIYAVIGLLVALIALSLVTFVIERL